MAYRIIRDKAVVRTLLNQLLKIVSVAGVPEKEIQMVLEWMLQVFMPLS